MNSAHCVSFGLSTDKFDELIVFHTPQVTHGKGINYDPRSEQHDNITPCKLSYNFHEMKWEKISKKYFMQSNKKSFSKVA